MSFEFMLPNDWQWETIDSLRAAGRSIVSGPFGSNIGSRFFVEEGIPIIRGNNLSLGMGQFFDYGFVFLTQEKAAEFGNCEAYPDDLIFTAAGTIGQVGIIPPNPKYPKYIISNKQLRARLDKSRVFPLFAYYWLASSQMVEMIKSRNTGSTVPLINLSVLKSLPIPVPPLNVQKGIVGILSALDHRITLLRETNTTLEAIAQALFKSWFVDFDPVRAKMEGREPEGMDAETAMLFPVSFEESELGLVPSGWRVEKVENWISVLETGRRPKGGVSGILEGIPSIGAESIVRIGQYDFSKIKYVSNEFFDKMNSGVLQSNDVLLYKDGGKPGVFLPRVSMFGDGFPFERCGINEHVFRIRLKKPFNQPFLYFWLWSDSVMHELKHRGGKAAIPGINQADVKEQRIFVPNSDVLHRFDELVSPLISRILSNAKKNQILTQLRDTLLPRLISGQLRLPEAETIVKEIH